MCSFAPTAGAPVGWLQMDPRTDAEAFVAGGLASMGIEADETELAVAGAAHEIWSPAVSELLEADLHVEPEAEPDMSRAPAP
jgi:hypothetical protein